MTRPATQNAMPGCRVVALSWGRPSHHEQRDGQHKRWEQVVVGGVVTIVHYAEFIAQKCSKKMTGRQTVRHTDRLKQIRRVNVHHISLANSQ